MNGNFDDLERADGSVCTGGDVVTVTATGHWQGRPVEYEEIFTTSCEAEVETDFVFRLILP